MVSVTMTTTMKMIPPPQKIPATTQQAERGRRTKHEDGSGELEIVVSMVNSVRLHLHVLMDWSVLVLLLVGENVALRMKVVST